MKKFILRAVVAVLVVLFIVPGLVMGGEDVSLDTFQNSERRLEKIESLKENDVITESEAEEFSADISEIRNHVRGDCPEDGPHNYKYKLCERVDELGEEKGISSGEFRRERRRGCE